MSGPAYSWGGRRMIPGYPNGVLIKGVAVWIDVVETDSMRFFALGDPVSFDGMTHEGAQHEFDLVVSRVTGGEIARRRVGRSRRRANEVREDLIGLLRAGRIRRARRCRVQTNACSAPLLRSSLTVAVFA